MAKQFELAYISNQDNASRWVFAPMGLRRGEQGYLHASVLGGQFDEEQMIDGKPVPTVERVSDVGTVLRPVGCRVIATGELIAVKDAAGAPRISEFTKEPLWNLDVSSVVVEQYRFASTGVKRAAAAAATAVPPAPVAAARV